MLTPLRPQLSCRRACFRTAADTIETSAAQAPLIEKQIHRDCNHRTRGEWVTMDEVLACDIFAFTQIRWVSDPGLAWA